MADTITTWTPISAPTDFRDDAVFDIDSKTKSIQVLVEQPIVAGENKSQFVKFQMGRYYDAIDLTAMQVNIVFLSPAGNRGISAAVNTEYSEDAIRFGWLVPYEACPEKGKLYFAVEFVGADYTLKTTAGCTNVLDSISDRDIVPEPVEQEWYIVLQANVATLMQEAQRALGKVEGIFNALGTPMTAGTAAEMVEESAIYVYTGSEPNYEYGYWYYHDGTEWHPGGEYASTALYTDQTPTQGSTNAVSSWGVYSALEDKADKDSTPETVTPEETDADFYLSDANGNVLLELADGHIKTKEFDSSDINTETDTTLSVQGKPADAKAVGDAIDLLQEEIDSIEPSGQSDINVTDQSTDADADLYISDTVGNGLVRVSDGHIQTKNFNSDNGCYKKVFAFTGSGTQTITRFFPSGTTLAFHLYDQTNKKTGAVASYKVTYKYTDRNSVEHTLGQDYGYNFPTYTLPEDATAVSVTYGNIIIGENHDLTFAVYVEGSFERKSTIIKVAQDGSGDFTTLRGAVDSISDNNEYNPFEIWIYAGTYNVLEDYTDEEISASGFQGLFICDGVSLIGQGQKSEIIINGTLDTTKFEQSKRNDVSTLNIVGTCRLENLTVNASYIRYAIHDDTGSPVHKRNSRMLKNLKVYGEHMTSGNYGHQSYGAGGSNLKTVYAKDCDFGDSIIIHTDSNASHSYHVYLENCTARRFNIKDFDSGIDTYFFLKNCKAQVINLEKIGDHAQSLILEGECTNDAMVICPSGYVYNLGDCRKFYNQSIAVSKAVKLTNNYGGIAVATSLDSVYGISLGVKDSVTYVQVSGWLNATMLGLTGLSVGDYLTIDSSGNVVSGGTASNAIAQVKFIDDGGIIFARMMI